MLLRLPVSPACIVIPKFKSCFASLKKNDKFSGSGISSFPARSNPTIFLGHPKFFIAEMIVAASLQA